MERTLLLFFSLFIEAIILWQYASNLFLPRYSAMVSAIFLCTLYCFLFFFSLLQYPLLNAILFLVVNILFFLLYFKLTFSSALLHSSIITGIMSVSELAAMGIVLKFYPKFSSTDNIGNVFFVMLSKSLFFTIIYFLTHIFKQKQAVQDPYDSSELFLTLIPLSSIFVMFTFLNIGETSSFVPPTNIMVTISAFFLILTNLLVFGITQYNQKKSREFTEMQLLLQKESDSAEYYKMLLSQNENRSILIHDIKKHLQSIKLLNEHGETEKIESYISHLIAASDLRETARICDNAMLNAILNRCQRQCIEKGIGFHADIRKNLLRQMNQNDLTSLFCNLLDNAVEAAENIPDSFIDLMVQKKENTPFVVIVLVNSCRSMPDFDQNGFPVSHKSGIGRHGFGIKSIRKAVGQYQGDLKIYYDDATATFHTIITLKQ